MNTDPEIPSYVYWGGFTGLILLGISIVIFLAFSILYNEAHDSSVSLQKKNLSTTEEALYFGYLSIGGLGFLLCLFIPFAHHLKSYHDPSVVSTKNGLHSEVLNYSKTGYQIEERVKPPSRLNFVGKTGSSLLPDSESQYKENLDTLAEIKNKRDDFL